MERRLFTPEDRIAPGLYMKYWDSIAKKYGEDSRKLAKLKMYRELRDGAILAALWTKSTGNKHFVSPPRDEPSDVEIYSLSETMFNEKPSYNLQRAPVQLTRCLVSNGETVVGQIMKKNKPSLAGTTLVVHMIGEDNVTLNINEIVSELSTIETIHPKEIAILAPLQDNSTPEQTYGLFLIHDKEDDRTRMSKVDLGDSNAFFDQPPVMRSLRGTGRAITPSEQINLMLP